jgi:hypothetical protein
VDFFFLLDPSDGVELYVHELCCLLICGLFFSSILFAVECGCLKNLSMSCQIFLILSN